MRRAVALVTCLSCFAPLACDEALPTGAAGVELTVRYADNLALDELLVSVILDREVTQQGSLPEPGHSLGADETTAELLLDGALDGEAIAIRVDGLSEGTTVGSEQGTVTLAAGRWTPLVLTLGAAAVVGDGSIHPTVEECDDGGSEAGDGCDDDGLIEAGYTCSGEPSVCARGDEDAGPGDAGYDAGGDVDAGYDAGHDAGGDVDAGFDAGYDAGYDAGSDADAGYDAGYDAGGDVDAGYDSGPGVDAGRDAGLDAGYDAGLDAGYDAGLDAGYDAGFDAGYDAGFDAGYDAGPPCVPGCDGDELVSCNGSVETGRVSCTAVGGLCCNDQCVANDESNCGTCDNTCGGGGSQCTPTCIDGVCIEEGAVIVTEFLADPTATDAEEEWVELYNTTTADIPIGGWTLADDEFDSVSLPAVTIPAESYLLLARNRSALQQNCSIQADEEYGNGFQLGNSGDEIALRALGCDIDHLAYGGGDVTAGDARALRSDRLDGALNDDQNNWCDATTVLSNKCSSDNGTPGGINDCP
jgi:cysteine-rich repeat protein